MQMIHIVGSAENMKTVAVRRRANSKESTHATGLTI